MGKTKARSRLLDAKPSPLGDPAGLYPIPNSAIKSAGTSPVIAQRRQQSLHRVVAALDLSALHPTATDTMSQRAGFRLLQRASQQQPTFRTAFRQPFFRRNVATADGPVTDATTSQGGFAKLWNSPVGPKTVHFWYAAMILMDTCGCALGLCHSGRATPLTAEDHANWMHGNRLRITT
jgi:hypothetical protein